MKVTKADIGKKVTLAPFEDQPREVGELLEVQKGGMVIVQVDDTDEGDDGLRELDMDQIEGFA